MANRRFTTLDDKKPKPQGDDDEVQDISISDSISLNNYGLEDSQQVPLKSMIKEEQKMNKYIIKEVDIPKPIS